MESVKAPGASRKKNPSATAQDTSELMLIAHMDAYAEAKKKYEPLLEKMAVALKNLASFARANNWHAYTTGRQILLKEAEQALQEYLQE